MSHGAVVWSFECTDIKSLTRKSKAARELGLSPVVRLHGKFNDKNGIHIISLDGEAAELVRGHLCWNGNHLTPSEGARLCLDLVRS